MAERLLTILYFIAVAAVACVSAVMLLNDPNHGHRPPPDIVIEVVMPQGVKP